MANQHEHGHDGGPPQHHGWPQQPHQPHQSHPGQPTQAAHLPPHGADFATAQGHGDPTAHGATFAAPLAAAPGASPGRGGRGKIGIAAGTVAILALLGTGGYITMTSSSSPMGRADGQVVMPTDEESTTTSTTASSTSSRESSTSVEAPSTVSSARGDRTTVSHRSASSHHPTSTAKPTSTTKHKTTTKHETTTTESPTTTAAPTTTTTGPTVSHSFTIITIQPTIGPAPSLTFGPIG